MRGVAFGVSQRVVPTHAQRDLRAAPHPRRDAEDHRGAVPREPALRDARADGHERVHARARGRRGPRGLGRPRGRHVRGARREARRVFFVAR